MENPNVENWKPWQPSKDPATRAMEDKQRRYWNKRSDKGEILKIETKEVIKYD